ncbi:unnamed protein product [marine sediment metagenome]|uniref:PSP1 C-terminal domain-containing protein n=1 Tax=marine sediment metagenome TaxID=412755 RepID=X0SVP2_9ZZZZ
MDRVEGDETPYGARHITSEALSRFVEASGENYPFRRNGRVLRLANQQDLIDFRHLETSAREERAYCREQIRALNLPMRLVAAEHMLGGERIVFYFTADIRVDFRALVRNLAGQFRTRIEMRQVGARDEARLVADYERCGQRCCCREFLKDLKPVSMRMAKVQKATLDPTKISGRCGRLMCCLRYEDDSYEELRKKLPKRGTWVRTEMHLGRVVDAQILTQFVRLAIHDGTLVAVPVEEILERNIEPPTEEEMRSHAARQATAQREEAREAVQREAQSYSAPAQASPKPEDVPPEEAAIGDEHVAPKKRRRPRHRKKSSGDSAGQTRSQAQAKAKSAGQTASSAGQGNPKKKRRRRRRKKPPNSGSTSS